VIKLKQIIPQTRTQFIEVKCPSCNNTQRVFSNPSRIVKCNVCATVLVEPTGGKGKIKKKSEKNETK